MSPSMPDSSNDCANLFWGCTCWKLHCDILDMQNDSIRSFSTTTIPGHFQLLKINFCILRSQQGISCFSLPLVKAGHSNSMFCTPDFDGLSVLLCSCNSLKPLFFPNCHCALFHVCLLCGVSQRGHVFLRRLSKIHAHHMERFSHRETGLDKYAVS